MDNLDQVDNIQCNIHKPYLSYLPCLCRNHALLRFRGSAQWPEGLLRSEGTVLANASSFVKKNHISAPSVANISSLINVDLMDNLDQVDNQQCNIYEPYLTSLPCLYRNHALLKTAHLTYLALSIPYPITLSLILTAQSSFPWECSLAGGPFEERRYCFS